MSEQTNTKTDEQKTLLWANVPWGVQDKETDNIQLTGYVDPTYLSLVLAKQLQEKEKKESTNKTDTTVADTSTSDI